MICYVISSLIGYDNGRSLAVKLLCMETWHASYKVVSWHFAGFSVIPFDHHASLGAPFWVILVSTPPSTIQGTRTSSNGKKLPGCEVIAVRVNYIREVSFRTNAWEAILIEALNLKISTCRAKFDMQSRPTPQSISLFSESVHNSTVAHLIAERWPISLK